MEIEDICRIEVPAEDNSILYLWATSPKLQEALQVMKAWGFEYKTHAIWDKGWVGMGYWFRGQHELLMVGVKGKMSPPEEKQRISSIFREKKGQHSSKPDYIKQMIGEWYPKETKLEMFARSDKTSLFQQDIVWDTWGDELKSSIKKEKKKPSKS